MFKYVFVLEVFFHFKKDRSINYKIFHYRYMLLINILRNLMLICLLFLQIGYTYYLSFQVLALLILIIVLLYFGFNIKISMLGIFSIMMFISFIFYTGIYSPIVISTKSTNSFLTVLALLVYSLMIFGFSLLYIKPLYKLLIVFSEIIIKFNFGYIYYSNHLRIKFLFLF